MMTRLITGFMLGVVILNFVDPVTAAVEDKFVVKPVVEIKAEPFSLHDVRLLGGPFKRAMDANAKWLLQLEPDRLLSRFREYAGLEPKGEIYGGWEKAAVSGHSLGHYLSACSLMYASTGDKEFLRRVNYIVEELALCQDKHGETPSTAAILRST